MKIINNILFLAAVCFIACNLIFSRKSKKNKKLDFESEKSQVSRANFPNANNAEKKCTEICSKLHSNKELNFFRAFNQLFASIKDVNIFFCACRGKGQVDVHTYHKIDFSQKEKVKITPTTEREKIKELFDDFSYNTNIYYDILEDINGRKNRRRKY